MGTSCTDEAQPHNHLLSGIPCFTSLGPQAEGAGAGPDAAEPSLRQLVEAFAEEQGVELLPKAGRRQDGLQVLLACLLKAVPCLPDMTFDPPGHTQPWC